MTTSASNFIKNIIENDLSTGKNHAVITRFPPEPNGYLHVGHAKAICINFGLANEFGGLCNLRFDDTNPEKESDEYVRSIKEDIEWLGFKWNAEAKYASDYFDKLYECAVFFIKEGLAYVCDLTPQEIRVFRGSFTEQGKNSPYRERTIDENLDLFTRMKNAEFADGGKTLRLKIDMTSPNINLRDPVIYRIKRAHHIRTGGTWCIYPMYDYAHSVSDAIEGITYSCCSLEFEDHRPLYDFVVEHLQEGGLVKCHPRQIEFSRLELQYTITSKRNLNRLVQENLVSGWDDPRMPTISGMRRRGYTPDGIKLFAVRVGVSKSPNIVDMAFLESAIRDDLEGRASRVMAVIHPLKVILTNFDDVTTSRTASFHPERPELGERVVELTKEIYIEQDDFMAIPIAKWQRLAIGAEVRLRHSYVIKCNEVIYDDKGNVVELHCSLDKNTLGKNPEGRKVKGVIHWVSTTKAIASEVRLYDRLFNVNNPMSVENLEEHIVPLVTVTAYVEPCIINAKAEEVFQFERLGYFVADRYDFNSTRLVFNKTVGLRDTWNKDCDKK